MYVCDQAYEHQPCVFERGNKEVLEQGEYSRFAGPYIILKAEETRQLKNDNLKKESQKVPKQDEDIGNLQILLHLRSLF